MPRAKHYFKISLKNPEVNRKYGLLVTQVKFMVYFKTLLSGEYLFSKLRKILKTFEGTCYPQGERKQTPGGQENQGKANSGNR